MTVHKWYALGASLLSVFLLSGTSSALAQVVKLQSGQTQLGVNLNLPLINQTRVGVVVPPTTDVGKLGASASVTVPSVVGLPGVGATIDVNTAAPAPIGVGVTLGSGTLLGTVPVPNTTAPDLAVAGNTGSLGPRLDLLPTCR